MGTILSYVTSKTVSSVRIESDPFLESSASLMAASKTSRDVARQENDEVRLSQDDVRRYSTALRDVHDFLNISEETLHRQRMLEDELRTCQERLRRFTEDHARQSESNVENINSTNSPSAMERKYNQFYDHERMDAVEVIEGLRKQKQRNEITEMQDKITACYIFEDSYEAAQTLRKYALQGIPLLLMSAPAIGSLYYEAKKKGVEFEFSYKNKGQKLTKHGQSSENSLKVLLKETAESCDIDALVQKTMGGLSKRQKEGTFVEYTQDFFHHDKIQQYIKKCCKYTWKLVCQTSDFLMEGNFFLRKGPVAFNPVAHQQCRDLTPSQHASQYIQHVVWPGLFANDVSSQRVIRKTEVILQSSQ